MGWGNVIACPKDDLLRSHPSQLSHLWAVPSPGIWAGSAACFWWTGHSGSDAAWLLGLSHQELCAVSALVSWDTGSWQAPFWNPAALLGDARTPEGAHMKVLWLTAPAELFADSQRWLLAICVMWPSSPAEPSEACSFGCSFLVSPQETPGEDCPAEPRWPTERGGGSYTVFSR